MADDRKVRITIETKADGTGAKAVAKSLEEVATSAAKVEQKSEASADAFQNLDAQLKKTQASASQVLQSQTRLIHAQNDAVEATRKQASQSGAAASGTKNLGAMAQQAGYQVGDFAVQVGSGTSALVAFAQQGSQLLGMLGPGGALAGAVLAIGAAMYNAFQKGGDSIEKAQEKAKAMTEALMETAKALGVEEFDDFAGDLERMGSAMEALYQGTIDQNDAIRDQAQAQFAIRDGWLKAAEAAIAYREATDPKFKGADARSQLGRDQRDNRRQQAISAEQGKGAQATDQYNAIFTRIAALEQQQQDMETRRAQLEVKQAEIGAKLTRFREIEAKSPGEQMSGDIISLAADLAKVQSDLEKTNSALNKVPEQIKNLNQQGMENAQKVDAINAEIATNIERINEQFDAEENAERAKEATEKVKDGVSALQKFVSDFQPLNESQKQAEAEIQTAIADGKLTADEVLKVSIALKTLQGTLKKGQEGNLENINAILTMMGDLASIIEQQKKVIAGLEERIGKLR